MYRKSVSSSNLSSVGYESGTLEIAFNSGGVYQYQTVPQNVYDALMSAGSYGTYFANYIKNSYTCRKVG